MSLLKHSLKILIISKLGKSALGLIGNRVAALLTARKVEQATQDAQNMLPKSIVDFASARNYDLVGATGSLLASGRIAKDVAQNSAKVSGVTYKYSKQSLRTARSAYGKFNQVTGQLKSQLEDLRAS